MNLYRFEIVDNERVEKKIRVEWCVAGSLMAAAERVEMFSDEFESIVLAEQHNDDSEAVLVVDEEDNG